MPIKDPRMSWGWWYLPVVPIHREDETGVRDQRCGKSEGETKGTGQDRMFISLLSHMCGRVGLE